MWAVASYSFPQIQSLLIHLLLIVRCLLIFSPSSFTQLLTHQVFLEAGAMTPRGSYGTGRELREGSCETAQAHTCRPNGLSSPQWATYLYTGLISIAEMYHFQGQGGGHQLARDTLYSCSCDKQAISCLPPSHVTSS